ncbi:glycosyltransferase family 4 protein [Methanothermobacter wolfeii]|uniref:glycosyltransferase family 4 protein n=1 Tax=Methanothermobacter wolfeii TaxID=145261 RepID=UPI0024B34140|nr:glycosyltransferase family 4 protein [Methanothermobacter wolfeii]MDI6702492.1 glycosyltransferase family 4 protein [Methanothermobacter wolfeii]MDI6841873.1 glycosyltransferase family 4 protein [Methanothermobacter wolfeii]
MKILIVSDFFVPHYSGGGERRYFEIARRLVERGHEVDVITMRIKGVPDHEKIHGINVYHLGPEIHAPPVRSSIDFIRFMLAVFMWIIRRKYDIIDAQTYSPLIPSLLASKLRRIPMLATIHDVSSEGHDQWIQSSWIASLLERILMRLPYNGIITVSESTASAIRGFHGRKKDDIHVLPNGVDLDLIDSVRADEDNSIIFVGRLAPHKHVDHLINVFRGLSAQFKDLNLRIIGDGVERNRLLKMVEDPGLGERVSFQHSLSYPEVISNIKGSKVLVLPSTREGFGIVLAEAGACRVPAVAYKSGGVVEVIKDGVNGFLVEPLNMEELHHKIRKLLEDDKLREKMGENGRRIVEERFIWDIIVDGLEEIYMQHI